MGIHSTLPGGMTHEQIRGKIGAALRHAFPLNSIRNAPNPQVLVIEDDDGAEWTLAVSYLPKD